VYIIDEIGCRAGQKLQAQIFFLVYCNTLEELIFESYLVKKRRMDGLLDSNSHAFASGLKVKEFYDRIINENSSCAWNFSFAWIPQLYGLDTLEKDLCIFLNSLLLRCDINIRVRIFFQI